MQAICTKIGNKIGRGRKNVKRVMVFFTGQPDTTGTR